MSGKHVRVVDPPESRTRLGSGARPRLAPGLAVAWIGARELFVFVALGIALPMALLVSPTLFDGSVEMTRAPVCDEDVTRNCLEAVPSTVLEKTTGGGIAPTWRLQEDAPSTDTVELSFPRSQDHRIARGDSVQALFWDGDPVGVLRSDGRVVEGLEWGPLHGVSIRTLQLAPLWPLLVVLTAWALLWRRRQRHGTKLWMLSIIGLGAAAAGPAAWVGMQMSGYRGLVGWGLAPLGIAFLAAGFFLAVVRLRARRHASRVPTPVVAKKAPAVPQQPERRPNAVPAQRSTQHPAQRSTSSTFDSFFEDASRGDDR